MCRTACLSWIGFLSDISDVFPTVATRLPFAAVVVRRAFMDEQTPTLSPTLLRGN